MNTLKQPARIFAVIFALTMLAAYVVYSQRQHSGTVMPSSKLQAPIIQATLDTNPAAPPSASNEWHRSDAMVFPGSKSMAPVIAVRQPPVAPPVMEGEPTANPSGKMIAPGSKSGMIFYGRQGGAVAGAAKPTASGSNAPAALPDSSGTNTTRTHK